MLRRVIQQIFGRDILRSVGISFFELFPNLAARYRMRKELAEIRKQAKAFFNEEQVLPEGASREDYYRALANHSVSISEYLYQYEFYKLSEKERNEFISRAEMRALSFKLRMMFPDDTQGLSRFKEKFLNRYSKLGFCKRRWLYTPESSFEQFADLLSSVDCIIKPHDGSLGYGVKKISKTQESSKLAELFNDCVKKEMLLEECVNGCDEIQAFHPTSLNTIRFVTMGFRGKAVPFGAFLRMGVGDMIIDNAHAGGLFAQINMDTGIIESEGITTDGLRVERHPDTGIQVKGYQIPRWNEIVDFCLDAARQTKNIISGWDVIITDTGDLEFIEVNNRPDFDVMQSPLRIGVKHKVLNTLSELTGRSIEV